MTNDVHVCNKFKEQKITRILNFSFFLFSILWKYLLGIKYGELLTNQRNLHEITLKRKLMN